MLAACKISGHLAAAPPALRSDGHKGDRTLYGSAGCCHQGVTED